MIIGKIDVENSLTNIPEWIRKVFDDFKDDLRNILTQHEEFSKKPFQNGIIDFWRFLRVMRSSIKLI